MVADRRLTVCAAALAAALFGGTSASAAPLARDSRFIAEPNGSALCGGTAHIQVRTVDGGRPDIADRAFQDFFGIVRIALSVECPNASRVALHGGNGDTIGVATSSGGWVLAEPVTTTEAAAQNSPPPTSPGLPRCNATVDQRGASMRIVTARLTDRPLNITGVQSMMTGDIKAYWVVDYEIVPHNGGSYKWSDGWIGNRGVDGDGVRWQAMRAKQPQDDNRVFQASERARGQAILILYYKQATAHTMSARITGRFDAVSGHSYGLTPYLDFDFHNVPMTCSDVPPAVVASSSGASASSSPGAGLIVPRQVLRPGTLKPSAPSQSVKYATQVGFIWQFGQGVYPDFEQALAWWREAERRQAAQGDYSMQNNITLSIRELTNNRIIDLLQLGQRKSIMGDWEYARFYFGRAAALGDVQGMSALGYAYGDGFKNPAMEIYWCRKAYRAAKAGGLKEFEIDAVNYFCPVESFQDLMTAPEKRANQVSITRAKTKSDAIRHQIETVAAISKAIAIEMTRDGHSVDDSVQSDIHHARRYSSGAEPGPPPTPVTTGFYGNCHGGAFYGC